MHYDVVVLVMGVPPDIILIQVQTTSSHMIKMLYRALPLLTCEQK